MKNDWFNEVRYGMFVHWGAYSVAARGEWVMNRERIPREEYTERYVNSWKAEQYDPAEWCNLAKDAGMGYIVLTTRHHDGFALWDSKVNSYNAVHSGPGRDLLEPYVKAVRESGLKLGFYYSPAAWVHPDYPGPFYRDWPAVDDWASEEARQRFIAYYRAELKELMTSYGPIDYLWFDGCIPNNLDGEETLKMIREWQPDIIINNRLAEPYDVKCCEQAIHPAPAGQTWEACMTLNDNWAYHAGDNNWKSAYQVVEMLTTCAASAGNLLLNVGPRADGTIPEESVQILTEAGKWVKRNREALTFSERHPLTWNNTARPITAKGNMLYLHFMKQPGPEYCLAELSCRVLKAYLLQDGKPLPFEQDDTRLRIMNLPVPLPDSPSTTLVLELDGAPQVQTAQTSFWIPGD